MEEGMHISFPHNIISNVISSSGLSTIVFRMADGLLITQSGPLD